MRVTRARARIYAAVGVLVGALLGGIAGAVATGPDRDAELIRDLRREVSAGQRLRTQLEDRVAALQKELRRAGARFRALADDPMRIGARGFEPLIALEGVGRMLYRCAGPGMKIALVEDRMSATAEVSYSLPGLPPLQKTLHPGDRILTPAITGPSSWTIVQATEPKSVTAEVQVGAHPGPCYLAPSTNATITSRSHDESV
jgi:hypothetical protein